MIRIVLENLLLFFLPTLAYVAYRLLMSSTAGRKGPGIDDAPFFLLFAAGAAVVIASLAFFASHSGGRPGEAYAPPVMRDGKIVPGHKIDPTPAPPAAPAAAPPQRGQGAADADKRNPG